MFYFFSKALAYFLTPAGWLLALLLVAFLTNRSPKQRRPIGAALLLFWLVGNSFLVNELALWLEYPPAPVPAGPARRVAVVLTGGLVNDRKPVPDDRFLLASEIDRAGQALYLYRKGAVQKILISGGVGDLPFQTRSLQNEGQMTARFLMMAGVRPGDIVLESKSRNTHENAVFSARVLRQRFRTEQYVLITSAWHMPRAAACFANEGVRVVPFPSSFISSQRTFMPGEWLVPHEKAFGDAAYLLKELVGLVAYWLAGYT